MIQAFTLSNRQVVPNWRSYDITVKLGELSNYEATNISQDSKLIDLSDLHDAWRNNRDLGHAADLLSTASIHKIKDDNVLDAANFIKNHKIFVSKTLYDLSVSTLGLIDA